MRPDVAADILAKMDIRLSSPDIEVLRIIANIDGIPSKELSYEEIYEAVNEEKEASRSWIYQSLGNLVESGFLHGNRLSRPMMYSITHDTLHNALEKARQTHTEILKEKCTRLKEQMKLVEGIEPLELAQDYHREILGEKEIEYTGVIDGNAAVVSAIAVNVFGQSRPGDTIRALTKIDYLRGSIETAKKIERRLLEAIKNEVYVKALLCTHEDRKEHLKLIGPFIEVAKEFSQKIFRNESFEIRVISRPTNTYRFVSLNDERIVLIMSDKPLANNAFAINSPEESPLLGSALETFDELWNEADDVTEIVRSLVDEKPT